jgi:N-acyl-D-amino-acid deacylase
MKPIGERVPSMLKLIDDAVASGMDICFDRYPYTAFSTDMETFVPLNDRQGSNEDVIARLKDPVKSQGYRRICS